LERRKRERERDKDRGLEKQKQLPSCNFGVLKESGCRDRE